MATQPRLAELLGALSLATDLGVGLGYETALRSSLIATSAGRMVGLDGDALSDVFYTSLLRFLGCTAFAHEIPDASTRESRRISIPPP